MKSISIFLFLILIRFSVFAQTYVWIQKASLPSVPRMGTSGFSIGNYGYVACGYTASGAINELWEYDAIGNTWSQKASLPGPVRYAASGFAINNKGYVCLGWQTLASNSALKDLWEYDPVNNSWTQKQDFPGSARYTASAIVINNAAYVGLGYSPLKNDFYRYEPALNLWTPIASLPASARQGAGAFSVDSLGFITCGIIGTTSTNDLWQYNPSLNLWTIKSPLPASGRYSPVTFVLNNFGFAGIGANINPPVYYLDFYKYNPATDTWSATTAFTGPIRTNAATFTIQNTGYVATGQAGSINSYLSDCWAFVDATALPEVESSKLLVYPNPFLHSICISGIYDAPTEVSLFNANGQMVYIQKSVALNNEIRINLSHLAMGEYTLIIRTKLKTISKKINKI